MAKRKRGQSAKKKTVKRRSPAAAALADPRFRKRVVPQVKPYRREKKVEVTEDDNG